MSLISRLFCCFRCPWNSQTAPKKPAYRPVDTADDDDDLLEEPNSADLSGDDWIDDDTRLTVDGHESPKPITQPPPKFSDKHQKHRIDSTNSQDNQSISATGLASLTSLFSKPTNLKLPPPPLDVPSHYYKQREADEKRRREGEALEVVTVGEFVPNGNDLDIDAFYHDLTNQPNNPSSANSTPSNNAQRQTSSQRSGVLNEMDLDDLLDELDVGGI